MPLCSSSGCAPVFITVNVDVSRLSARCSATRAGRAFRRCRRSRAVSMSRSPSLGAAETGGSKVRAGGSRFREAAAQQRRAPRSVARSGRAARAACVPAAAARDRDRQRLNRRDQSVDHGIGQARRQRSIGFGIEEVFQHRDRRREIIRGLGDPVEHHGSPLVDAAPGDPSTLAALTPGRGQPFAQRINRGKALQRSHPAHTVPADCAG